MYVTGNGNLYISGHVNSNFDLKRKLTFTEQNITEVEQPHYYVGLKTKTLAAITLYKTKEMKEVVATLPKDYKIEVLLAETSLQDLVDNDNSQEDYCNGFELDKIEADFHSSSPVTWNNWRDEIIANRSTNPTVNKVSDLFAAWKM